MLKLKSLKEPTLKDDGLRIMISRYGIRGQKKEDREWDQWKEEGWKELAPSPVLLREYIKQKKISWDEYVVKYTLEIKYNPKALEALSRLKSLIATRTVTILCHCIDETRCHRSIIKQMIDDDY
ncbi:MAG: hypothetical protein DLM72_08750 [Candidatus Nitrosopolaris wilkensis]|nr:MAG: hypothetical protein DLM72_08750 [Candidatus Nitrosopolaris wilkensis]